MKSMSHEPVISEKRVTVTSAMPGDTNTLEYEQQVGYRGSHRSR